MLISYCRQNDMTMNGSGLFSLHFLMSSSIGSLTAGFPVKWAHVIYLIISCTLTALQGFPTLNSAFRTLSFGLSNCLDRVGQILLGACTMYCWSWKRQAQVVYVKTDELSNNLTMSKNAATELICDTQATTVLTKLVFDLSSTLTWANSPMVASTLITTPGLGSGSFNLRISACKGKRYVCHLNLGSQYGIETF